MVIPLSANQDLTPMLVRSNKGGKSEQTILKRYKPCTCSTKVVTISAKFRSKSLIVS